MNYHFIYILNSATIHSFHFIDKSIDHFFQELQLIFSIREEEMTKNQKGLQYFQNQYPPALEHSKHMVISMMEMSQGCQTVTSSDILSVLLAFHQHDAYTLYVLPVLGIWCGW